MISRKMQGEGKDRVIANFGKLGPNHSTKTNTYSFVHFKVHDWSIFASSLVQGLHRTFHLTNLFWSMKVK